MTALELIPLDLEVPFLLPVRAIIYHALRKSENLTWSICNRTLTPDYPYTAQAISYLYNLLFQIETFDTEAATCLRDALHKHQHNLKYYEENKQELGDWN